MDELYPKHAEALRALKLAPEVFPTMGKILDETRDATAEGEKGDTQQKERYTA